MKALSIVQKGKFTAHVFAFFAVVFLLIYILSTFLIVKNIVVGSQAREEINKLSGVVGDLEFKYISMKNSLNKDSLATVGLETTESISYVSRSSGATALANVQIRNQ